MQGCSRDVRATCRTNRPRF